MAANDQPGAQPGRPDGDLEEEVGQLPVLPTFVLEPVSERFDPLDDRWLDQVSAFSQDLDRQVGGVAWSSHPVAGTKGEATSLILALGSAGAFTAAAEFFKAWLARNRGTTSLKVSWRDESGEQSVELAGGDLDEEALQRIARSVATRLEAHP